MFSYACHRFLLQVDKILVGYKCQVKSCFSLLFFTTIVKNNNIFLFPSFVLSCCAILENKIIGRNIQHFLQTHIAKIINNLIRKLISVCRFHM